MENPIEYDGIQWFQEKRGYYKSHAGGLTRRLHVYKYEKEVAPVPEGYVVHHIDHDRENNSLDNLLLMTDREHRQHHGGDSFRGHHHTAETKEALSKAKKGRIMHEWSPESREKLSKSKTGERRTAECRARMSESAKKRIRVPHSPETKAKMAEAARRRWANRSI